MKQPTKFIKVSLRQLSEVQKKPLLTKDTPIQIWLKEKMDRYERNNWQIF